MPHDLVHLQDFFDYTDFVKQTLEANVEPFRLTNVRMTFYYDAVYFENRMRVRIGNLPELSYETVEDSANFAGLTPQEICERISEPFRLKLEEWWKKPRDIPDTIELGEN